MIEALKKRKEEQKEVVFRPKKKELKIHVEMNSDKISDMISDKLFGMLKEKLDNIV